MAGVKDENVIDNFILNVLTRPLPENSLKKSLA